MSDLKIPCEGKGSVPQAKSRELPKQVQVQVLLVAVLESQRCADVAEANSNTWRKAQDVAVAQHSLTRMVWHGVWE